MFDAVRNNKLIVQGFLALITLPFAFWGVESYVGNMSGGNDIATVGDSKISVPEFQGALREQQDRLRQQLGGRLEPGMLESPEMRRAVVENLVTRRLLALEARKANLTVSDADLARFIAGIPALQVDGKFSPERYAAAVAAQGMSREGFEAGARQDLAVQQIVQPVGDAVIAGRAASMRWATLQLEQREVAELRLSPENYAGQISVADADIDKYYNDHRKEFELPEQVRVEYLTLSQEQLMQQARVGEDEIKARYESRAATYQEGETRRASHVLIPVAKDAPEAEQKAAQAKVEEVEAALKKAPNDFGKLAKQYSQDTVSAAQGGDLGWFGRGAMVKPFEDAVFSLKEGETSGVVRSDFGLHVIRVTGIRAAKNKPLAEVREEIAAELKKEQAAKRFAEAAEAFGNTVYEQSDSLQPAAEKWKLTAQKTDWLARGGKLAAPFDNAKLATAVFSDDAVKHKRNTEAVEVAPGTLVSARVVEHKPAALQPLDAVRGAIRGRLQAESAAKLAVQDGEAKLAALRKGENPKLNWSTPRSYLRGAPLGLAADAAREIFKADAAKLPAYAGAAMPGGGFALYRISAVKPAAADDPRAGAAVQQYAGAIAGEEFAAWLATLRQKYPVTINTSLLEQKDR